MVKCTACGRYIAARGGATCCKCTNKYHLACVQLAETAKVSPNWRCTTCKTGKNTVSPVVNAVVSGDLHTSPSGIMEATLRGVNNERDVQCKPNMSEPEIVQELRLLRLEITAKMDELKGELEEYRCEMGELRKTVVACNKRVDSMELRLAALENRNAPSSEGLAEQLESTVSQLRLELNDREQELLSSDLEIGNLPEEKGENLLHTIELVAKKLGVTLQASDIVFAERVGPRLGRAESTARAIGATPTGEAERERRIVVRLARRQLRDDMLRSARVRRGITSADLGFAAPPRRFYLNERLTKANKQLFYRTRQAATLREWKYTWTKHGRILVKQSDGKRTYGIRSEADIRRVFGSASETNINS